MSKRGRKRECFIINEEKLANPTPYMVKFIENMEFIIKAMEEAGFERVLNHKDLQV